MCIASQSIGKRRLGVPCFRRARDGPARLSPDKRGPGVTRYVTSLPMADVDGRVHSQCRAEASAGSRVEACGPEPAEEPRLTGAMLQLRVCWVGRRRRCVARDDRCAIPSCAWIARSDGVPMSPAACPEAAIRWWVGVVRGCAERRVRCLRAGCMPCNTLLDVVGQLRAAMAFMTDVAQPAPIAPGVGNYVMQRDTTLHSACHATARPVAGLKVGDA